MKTALVLMFALSTAGAAFHLAAADGQANSPQNNEADRLQTTDTPAKRIVSVTLDTDSGKLVWVVQSGIARNGDFIPQQGEERYEITPEQAIMAFQGQQRGFTGQEAAWLQSLLRVLTVYCAESTVWWDQGEGVPLDHGKPAADPPADKSPDPETAPHKVINPPQRKTPGSVQLVAVNFVR